MSARMSGGLVLGAIMMIVAAAPASAEDQSAGEAAGAGQRLREVETPPAVICGGCVTPTFAGAGKGSIVPYGRIELDAIYSNRNTNPLDPGQFNGYATAAGKSSNASSTLAIASSDYEPTGQMGNTRSPVS